MQWLPPRLVLAAALSFLFILAMSDRVQSEAEALVSPGATESESFKFPDLYEASIAELQDGLERGHFTSVDLVNVSRTLYWDLSTWLLILIWSC